MKKFELSIPKPCHEIWDGMTPEAKGRFCRSCQKTVVDFTNMSDRQLAAFFKKPVGSVCGRFNVEQLNHTLEVPRKRIPWVKYFFTIALPAFLVSKKAAAQGEVKLTGKVACLIPIKRDTIALPIERISKEFTGRVLSEAGAPIPFASIIVKGTNNGVMADSLGYFKLNKLKSGQAEIIISAVNFESSTIIISADTPLTIILSSSNSMMVGELIITSVKKSKPIPLIPSKRSDSAFTKFSVYPNPAKANSPLTLDLKSIHAGDYLVSIINSDGTLVQSEKIEVEKKRTQTSFALHNIPAGPYFIRLTNTRDNKTYTEIIVVQ